MSEDSEDFEYLFKIVLIGDSGVGKSNLLTRYTRDEFNLGSKATIGVELAHCNLEINGKKVRAQIWDTAGQERYRAVTSAYYRGAMGAILVYDITKKTSFQSLQKWYDEVKNFGEKETVMMLLGNKFDLKHLRDVEIGLGKEFAEKHQMTLFLETSALDSTNVNQAFEGIIKKTYEKVSKDEHEVNKIVEEISAATETVNLDSIDMRDGETNGNGNKSCCGIRYKE